MEDLGLIDIGGTSIKFGVLVNEELKRMDSIKTPENLEDFYKELTTKVNEMKNNYPIAGVGISSPDAVNKKTGIVEGISAISYIHNFKIQPELSKRFDLPVSMENDANCAALAEVKYGAGKNVNNLLFLIIGTGVGGSFIVNRKIIHGAHLFGGEFGFTLNSEDKTLSELGTSVGVANRYNEQSDTNYTGKEVFDLAKKGDKLAQKEVQIMYHALAKGIYNLQYSFDPELIVLGGAVSNNPDLLPGVKNEIEKIRKTVEIAPFSPKVVLCKYTNESNLLGAAVDFHQTYGK
ncbi:ROK family protein [Lactobacillus halodurans]|uniref:ROK family protein n=1 Tax=Companilactobacillus halodurans TaxID=2584183 RepID=A0A5P0ZS22_9LACO|nr:ROK family protein [Companilactobacillus halodurans]MQS76869.1 ROK family protein [Companilactobacillus halodurans]